MGPLSSHGDCHLLEDGAQLSVPSKNMETWEAGTLGENILFLEGLATGSFQK